MREPFPSNVVKQHLLTALSTGGLLTFPKHALEEMGKDDLLMREVRNALRSGTISAGEVERGVYRYRVHSSRLCAVVAIRPENEVVVVTSWRFR